MNYCAVENDIRILTEIIDGYFGEGTTREQKIQWICKQIEFMSQANCNLRNKINEDLADLRNGRRRVRALRIILKKCEK